MSCANNGADERTEAEPGSRSVLETAFQQVGLGPLGFGVVFATVFVGALVQGAIGFGLNLLVVPIVAALRPEALPAAAIVLALPMTLGSALREHRHIDRPAILWTSLGRLPGVAIGAWVVSVLETETLALVIGGIVLAGVGMSLASPRIRIDRASQAVVGFVSGVMGTASSIGGPPMALLYQREPGPVVRATLGATFLVGVVLSLGALALAGEARAFHWWFGGAMTPAVLLGLWASRRLHARLDGGWLRPCVLAVSGVSAIAVLVRGLATG